VPERLFLFTQLELPWALGPPDGRYLVRRLSDGEPEWVVVLGTVGAGRVQHEPGPLSRCLTRRKQARRAAGEASSEPAPVQTSRVTIIDPVPVSAERQAQAWLAERQAERDVERALAVLNRLLHSHRIATANPFLHEVSAGQALVVRAGYGEGEQVADGRWTHAREVLTADAGARGRRARRGRSAALRPQERLAELLGAREAGLVCEELALRARLDLDQGRLAHAAIQLSAALDAALSELRAEGREDLALRVDELQKLKPGVTRDARSLLGADGANVDEHTTRYTSPIRSEEEEEEEEDVVRHALERLEAALRARTAVGFGR
jgi:hypothetical protein